MIKKLERVAIETREDGTQVSRLPNNEEMWMKINEIIDYINRQEREKELEMKRKFDDPLFGITKAKGK